MVFVWLSGVVFFFFFGEELEINADLYCLLSEEFLLR